MDKTREKFKATGVIHTVRAQGRSVTWLARNVGVSRQYMSDVAHGHILVKRPFAKRVADALGMAFFLAFDVSDDTDIGPVVIEDMEEAVA